MPEKLTITVFTEGDSLDAAVWSNVPYFLTNTLESKSHTVHRVDVNGNPFFRSMYDKGICRFLRHSFMPHTTFTYQRSYAFHQAYNRIMKHVTDIYPDTDLYLSTSFSYAPVRYTDKPCALFCDWTYQYYFEHFLKRRPDWLEQREVKRQNQLLETVDYIFVLFPDVAKRMQETYENKHIYYLGNVINSDPVTAMPSPILQQKLQHQSILFIGLPKYMEGVKSLIKAVTGLHEQQAYADITLDIIGMDQSCFDDLPVYIRCHGYLSKSDAAQKKQYYDLVDNATVYVNTTPLWAGFSSALEALYHHLPVITTPYESFCDTFGKDIDFGFYCNSNEPDAIASCISSILNMAPLEYEHLCQHAHNAALPFSWDIYVDKMLHIIKNLS